MIQFFFFFIQTTNLSDSQIIENLLDLVEKRIFTLIIHSVQGCISSHPERETKQTLRRWEKRYAQMEMNLSHTTTSFSASLPFQYSLKVIYGLSFFLSFCLLSRSSHLVNTNFCRFFLSLSKSLNLSHCVQICVWNLNKWIISSHEYTSILNCMLRILTKKMV